MKVQLDLEQRIWMVDQIGQLPSNTELLMEASSFIGLLAPTHEEVSVEGLNLKIDSNGITWDKEVESERLPKKEYEVPSIILDSLKIKYSTYKGDLSGLDFKMLDILKF